MTTFAENQARAQVHLDRIRERGVQHRIHGEWRSSVEGKTFTTISPVDLEPLADVAEGTAADIDAAANAAAAAFADWSAMDGSVRKSLLHGVADGIVERADEIALIESVDTGQAIRFMSKAAIRGAENFRFFADRAPEARDGRVTHAPGQVNMTARYPIGPVGVITPWNTPFMLSTWKIAPALAAGCTVVHKPAELSPLSATILVEIAEEAGIPPGVFNLVHGAGETAGRALTEHPNVRAIGFVGESRTGSQIMRQGADTLKRVHFELGGKNPVIVCADADLDRAADAVVFMIYSLNGERCTSSSRLLVERSIQDAFIERVARKARGIRVGHPLDPATVVGPLIHPVHQKKVQDYIGLGQAEGATLAFGGGSPNPSGCYVEPTLFTDAHPDMRISREEIFGPVLTALPFDDDEDAIALANAIDYGLCGYVWTSDVTRAFRLSENLDVGMVWVNSENVRHLPTPFGGAKASGIGRDGGDWSFEFYMETRNVAFATTRHHIPRLGG